MALPYKEGVPYYERIEGATKTGLLFGSAVGAVRGSWDFHIERTAETTLQGMAKTATTLASSVVLFGGIALTYAVAESACEAVRGVADWKNGALAGLAAGSVVGLRAGRVQTAANAGMLFCAASVAMDLTNGRMRTNLFSKDHEPSNPYQDRLGLPKY